MPERLIKTKFYNFTQNNSGGVFTEPAIHVYVEATSVNEACDRAEEVGVYFGGFGDCECCGDRWYRPWDGDDESSTEAPTDFTPYWTDWSTDKVPQALVYYYDGRQEIHKTK